MKIHPGAEPQTPEEQVVVAFLDTFGPGTFDQMCDGYRKWMTDDVLWTNTGSPPCHGLDEALQFMEVLHDRFAMEYCTAELFSIASRGSKVLTERIDRVFDADDNLVAELPIMGTFEVRDGKVVRYSDYSADHDLKTRFPSHAQQVAG